MVKKNLLAEVVFTFKKNDNTQHLFVEKRSEEKNASQRWGRQCGPLEEGGRASVISRPASLLPLAGDTGNVGFRNLYSSKKGDEQL